MNYEVRLDRAVYVLLPFFLAVASQSSLTAFLF
jgi:hypothetical protein